MTDEEALTVTTVRAMNSDIEFLTTDSTTTRQLVRAERWLAAYEDRFSRFRILSELSKLNASAGRPFRASPQLYRLVEHALELAQRSDGLFDPTVLPLLDAAGYDRSFELIRSAGGSKPHPTRPATWRDVVLDPKQRTILMPEGCGIDLGGIGKGWAVDRLAAMLTNPCLVNGGGDVYARGRPGIEPGWRIGVADPFQPEHDRMVLTVEDRGVATSSTLKRRWRDGDLWAHHLIDPRTARPSQSDAVQVTVVAGTASEADYHAKVALLLGCKAAITYLDREAEVEGLVIRNDGQAFASARLARYEHSE